MFQGITFLPKAEIEQVAAQVADANTRLALIADMCRFNALATIKGAGSGHIGSSFSALDIITFLYFSRMNLPGVGFDAPDRDIFFSSKGHDVPGHYAVLYALGILGEERFLNLRRLGGTPGHPDIFIEGIEANSGSLGMGISKGRGMAAAKRHKNEGGTVFVLIGDGELQEGQNYEALRNAGLQQLANLIVILDRNEVQSDKRVAEISDTGDIAAIAGIYGWHVARCNGHEFGALSAAFSALDAVTDRPKLLIADTIKGRGVSFMEHPRALEANNGLYPWHAGAPDDQSFERAASELLERINSRLRAQGLREAMPQLHRQGPPKKRRGTDDCVARAYGETLCELAGDREDLIVLDADLAADCRLRPFERRFPRRFIECGISEQDMVSTAGGLALQGMLPVVNSFAAFLAARANEQIYNNASEAKKIVYGLHYAGLLPAGPGLSHQSVRDISLLGTLPNLQIIQPCNELETRLAVDYAVNLCEESCALRLQMGPSPWRIKLPGGYSLRPGRGEVICKGDDAVLFAYGPVMLYEALKATRLLRKSGIRLAVVNMPWLNRVDEAWLEEQISSAAAIFILDDHSVVGGLGDFLLSRLVAGNLWAHRIVRKFGVASFPVWGNASEALAHHGLDGAHLAAKIKAEMLEPHIVLTESAVLSLTATNF